MQKKVALTLTAWMLATATLYAESAIGEYVYNGGPAVQKSAAYCDSCCDTACGDAVCCDRWYLLPQDPCGINVHGWADVGFMGNTSSPDSRFHGPYNAVDRSNEIMLNQMYLVAEKNLFDCGCSLGGRVDLLYGEDYFLAKSIGLEARPDGSPRWNSEYYGLAVPQAYVAMGNNNLNLQLGHFYSVVGYEGVMAPANFFYSKSYSYQFAGPFTHWGGQVNWKMNDAWTLQLGVHNGWDALDRVSDDLGFIGKVRWDSRESDVWSSFAVTTGKEYNNGGGLPIVDDFTNRTRYSWLVSLPLTCRMEYVFHHWLGFQQRGALDGGQADWYGIDQYLFYKINECWKTGLRFEWFRDEEGTRVGLNRLSNPNDPPFAGNFFSLSLGVNWSPTYNFMLRPEVRYDWYDGNAAQLPFNDGADDDQFMLGLDAILLF
jgi:hypothetical protein